MTVPANQTPTHEQWAECTFEGAELAELRRTAAIPFADKIKWLEEAHRLSLQFQEARRKKGLPTLFPDGRIEY